MALQAAEASLYHPRGLLYDSQGNLYISTERGLIRKVDPNGRITTFAGKLESEGGVLADNVHSSEMLLNKPYGMVIDEAINTSILQTVVTIESCELISPICLQRNAL